jgi:ketosteroid isomerase-like protein
MITETIKDQIAANEETLLNAFQQCDLETLDKLLHDNVMFVLPNGEQVNKTQVLDNYRSGNMAMSTITPSEQVIQITDDNAVVALIMKMQGNYFDQIISRKFRYIRVWKRFGTDWKVIAVSGVQLP